MAYSTPSTQVTGYVVLAADWNEFVNNFIAMAPDLFTADGEIHVATAANVGKALLAFTADLLLHELGALEADVSAFDGFPLIDSGATSNHKMSFAESDAPDANDDTTDGWKVGSMWIDTTNDKVYVCVDITDTAAVWKELSAAGTVATGSYTGDGTTSQAITGLGFTVKWVWISKLLTDNQSFSDRQHIWTSDVIIDDDASGLAITVTSSAVITDDDAIITLGADGFTVDDDGTDDDPNANTIVYNYVAMG